MKRPKVEREDNTSDIGYISLHNNRPLTPKQAELAKVELMKY